MNLGHEWPQVLHGRDLFMGFEFRRNAPERLTFFSNWVHGGSAAPIWTLQTFLSEPAAADYTTGEIFWDVLPTPTPAVPQFFRFKYHLFNHGETITSYIEFWYNGVMISFIHPISGGLPPSRWPLSQGGTPNVNTAPLICDRPSTLWTIKGW